MGIIFAEMCILDKIEVMADKTRPDEVEKLYILEQKHGKKSGDKSTVKKISENIMDTYNILDGIGRNLRQPISTSNPYGTVLSYVHIMKIKISAAGW